MLVIVVHLELLIPVGYVEHEHRHPEEDKGGTGYQDGKTETIIEKREEHQTAKRHGNKAD